jgi:hypothetical protein
MNPADVVRIAPSEYHIMTSTAIENTDRRRCSEDNSTAGHDIPIAMTSGRSFVTEFTTRYFPSE